MSPDQKRVAYVRGVDEEQELVVRELQPAATATVVARNDALETYLTDPAWDADSRGLAFGLFGWGGLQGVDDRRCHITHARLDTGASWSWPGDMSDFAAGCPSSMYWDSDSGRLAAFEHGFESPISRSMAILPLSDASATLARGGEAHDRSVVARLPLEVDYYARAQSPDGVWLALLDSAAYYPGPPLAELLHAWPERWPGRARLRLLNVVSTGVLDVAAWETDAGMTGPVWAPDGSWIAFAEPMGVRVTPTPYPTHPAYPGPVPSAGGPLVVESVRIRRVDREGQELENFTVPQPSVWPVAVSPDGRFLLLVAAGTGLLTHDTQTGIRSTIVTVSAWDADWIP